MGRDSLLSQPFPNHEAAELIAKWEGFREKSYICPSGWPTIGYGSTRWFNIAGQPKVRLGQSIDRDTAWELLEITIAQFWDEIQPLIYVPLNQNQVNAIVSFAYNIGTTNFRNSTFLKLLNQGDFDGASAQIPRWNKGTVRGVKKELRGLTNRRADERKLFDMPVPIETPAVMQGVFHNKFENPYNYGDIND